MPSRVRIIFKDINRYYGGADAVKATQSWAKDYDVKPPLVKEKKSQWEELVWLVQAMPSSAKCKIWVIRERRGIHPKKSRYVRCCSWSGARKALRKPPAPAQAPAPPPAQAPDQVFQFGNGNEIHFRRLVPQAAAIPRARRAVNVLNEIVERQNRVRN